MTVPSHESFTTTIRLPFALQAQLDAIRLERGIRSGHRPKMRDLVLEALDAFVAVNTARPKKTQQNKRGGVR